MGFSYALISVILILILMLPLVNSSTLFANAVSGKRQHFSSPGQMEVNPRNGNIYVVNEGSTWISVINHTNNKVIKKIELEEPVYRIAIDTLNGDIYATHALTSITHIDGSTYKVISRINVTSRAIEIGFDPSTGNIYVPQSQDCSSPRPPCYPYGHYGSIVVINGTNDSIIKEIIIGSGTFPGVSVFDTVNGDLYVGVGGKNYGVYVIDDKTNSVKKTIQTQAWPAGIEVDSRNGYIYVANGYGGRRTIDVIDGTINKVINSIILPNEYSSQLGNGAYDSKNREIYFSDVGNKFVIAINGTTKSFLRTITLPDDLLPVWLVFDQKGEKIYVSHGSSDSISIIDGKTDSVKKTIY